MVLGFEPTAFRTCVSSHNPQIRALCLFLLFLYAFLCKCLGLYDLFCFIFISGHLRQIWTGGVAGLRAKKQTLYWDGSLNKMGCKLTIDCCCCGSRYGVPQFVEKIGIHCFQDPHSLMAFTGVTNAHGPSTYIVHWFQCSVTGGLVGRVRGKAYQWR